MSKKKKVTLEALQKFLEQEGKLNINKKKEKYYQFSCPICKELGHDSDDNHLVFYPEKRRLICVFQDENTTKNAHGIKLYNRVKELLEEEE